MACGIIYDVQKFSLHDGPGIRTTIFFKGCPLRCIWCHNPESQEAYPEIMFDPSKCIGCNECAEVCLEMAICDGEFDRSKCVRCGKCTDKCNAGARELAGREICVEDLLLEVLKDSLFYKTSGGGLTLSGGEPMFQFEFVRELLVQAKANGLNTVIETCGFAPVEYYIDVTSVVDLFLFDIKETEECRHLKYTGVTMALIHKNLFALDQVGAKTILRCPIIPSLNNRNDHFYSIAELANRLKHVQEIHVLPYHSLGRSKLQRLGRAETYDIQCISSSDSVDEWIKAIQDRTNVLVIKG